MKRIIIVSHGTIAKGIYQAATMIYGDFENAHYLCLEEDMGIDTFKKSLEALLEVVKDAEQIVVLADLQGGSPYTAAVTALAEKGLLEKSHIITGLNLPMMLSVLFVEDVLTKSDVEEIIQASKEGISPFLLETSDDEEL